MAFHKAILLSKQQQQKQLLFSVSACLFHTSTCRPLVSRSATTSCRTIATKALLSLDKKSICPASLWTLRDVNIINSKRFNNLPYGTKSNYFSSVTTKRFDSTFTRGYDLTADIIALDGSTSRIPKVVVTGYGPSGFDVLNTVRKIDPNESNSEQGTVHMTSSIIVFPQGCFLWNITNPSEVTVESLSIVLLHRPKITTLFVGYNRDLNNDENNIKRDEFYRIRMTFQKAGVSVEEMPMDNAIGTFNLLNAEDRYVASALVIDTNSEE